MKVIILCLSVLFITSCTNEDRIKTILLENPDILVEVIKKNPQKFAGLFGSPQGNRPSPAEELARREEDFKNPKKPLVDLKRAIRGNAEAPITIVAYSDFQCPFCSKGEMIMEEVQKKYGSKVRYLFKHFPLPFHPQALPAAKTYEAIALQSREKALRFQDEVFQNQQLLGQLKEAFLDKAAEKVGANMDRMRKDRDSEKVAKIVEQDIEEGKAMGVRGTPAFLVNGVFVAGARPPKDFEEIIERWLKK